MRYAIFSDIHANRQAWNAVLADMYESDIDVPVCLGDIVGYGPCPQEVLDGIRAVTGNFVMGNHDAAACGVLDPTIFNDTARSVIEWTADQLKPYSKTFLSEMPMVITDGELMFVHAEIEEPDRFYYIESEEDAKDNFVHSTHRIVFVGHTHDPVIFSKNGDSSVTQHEDSDCVLNTHSQYIINVGSVGEPRNPEDIRARYVIFDSETNELTFRRIEFDVEAYRSDLAASGLTITPYFLQVVDSYNEAVAMAKKAKLMRDMRTPSKSVALRKRGASSIQKTIERRPRLSREPVMPVEVPRNSKRGLVLSLTVLALIISLITFIFFGGEYRPQWASNVAGVVKAATASDPELPVVAKTAKVVEKTASTPVQKPVLPEKPAAPVVVDEITKLRKNLNKGLVFYAPFDESASHESFIDRSGKKRHINAKPVKHGIPGKSGNAVHFKKKGIESAPAPLAPILHLTISFWFFADDTQVNKEKSAVIVSSPGFGGVFYDDQKLKINVSGERRALSFNFPPNGKWNHILVIYGGSNTTVYKNGKQWTTKRRKKKNRKQMDAKIKIGAGESRFRLDEVAVWRRPISGPERAAVFQLGNKGKSLIKLPNEASP